MHTFIFVGKNTASRNVELARALPVEVYSARQEGASINWKLAQLVYSCTLRRLYLDPCERFSEATRFSEAMFCILAKLLKLQVCVFMLHMHRCPKARQGKDHNPKGARARVFTQTCALAPAHGQRPATRMPKTQACLTDASGVLSFKERRE